jgi:hypothetical protein
MVRHQTSNRRPLTYDSAVMDAKNILERVASLKEEMQDLLVANARLDEPRHSRGNYEARRSRLEEIKLELAEMLYDFKRRGTNLVLFDHVKHQKRHSINIVGTF